MNKIKSLDDELVKCRAKLKSLTSAELDKGPNSKDQKLYNPPFKRDHKQKYKTNIDRINKGKRTISEMQAIRKTWVCPYLSSLL